MLSEAGVAKAQYAPGYAKAAVSKVTIRDVCDIDMLDMYAFRMPSQEQLPKMSFECY